MRSLTRVRRALFGSRPRIVGVVAVALVLVLAVASLVVRSRIESRIAALASCRFAAGSHASASLPLSATVGAVFGGDLGTVTVRADSARIAGLTADLVVRLQDVHTASLFGGSSPARIGGVDASATVPYAELAGRFDGAEAAYAGGSDVVLRRGDQVGGPQVRATLTYSDGAIVVTPTAVQIRGRELPLDIIRPLLERNSGTVQQLLEPHRITLPDLPSGLRVTGVTAGEDGVTLQATADHPDGAGAGGRCR